MASNDPINVKNESKSVRNTIKTRLSDDHWVKHDLYDYILNIPIEPSHMLMLPNHRGLIISNGSSCYVFTEDDQCMWGCEMTKMLKVYNEKTKCFENISPNDPFAHRNQNLRGMNACGIAIAKNEGYFFIADDSSKKIFRTDLSSMHRISKSYDGRANNDENDPANFITCRGMACSSKYLYVCDHASSAIKILTFDLKFVESFKVDFRPEFVKVTDRTLCASGDEGLYFYDVKTKKLRHHYESDKVGNYLAINEIDSEFYVFNVIKRGIDCYDENGTFVETINAERFFSDGGPYNQFIGFFGKRFLMTVKSGGSIWVGIDKKDYVESNSESDEGSDEEESDNKTSDNEEKVKNKDVDEDKDK